MAEFINIPEQTIAYNQPIPLMVRKACNKGYVLHREGAGIITLRGIVNNPCNISARYSITFNGNIATPAGGTVGEIAVGIAISGEVDGASIAVYTTTTESTYGNVTSTTQIDVPKGCCFDIAVVNVSTNLSSINVKNANLVISRIG